MSDEFDVVSMVMSGAPVEFEIDGERFALRQMTPAERRTELCGLLALGLVRLRMRDGVDVSDNIGERCLHYPPDQCRHATPTHRRNA